MGIEDVIEGLRERERERERRRRRGKEMKEKELFITLHSLHLTHEPFPVFFLTMFYV